MNKTVNFLNITLPDGRISTIMIGEKLSSLPQYIGDNRAVIICDNHVYDLYHQQFPPIPCIVIPAGEDNKTLLTIDYLAKELIQLEADRSTVLIGIGGGMVCDITGFLASTYMRGVKFGFVATTLLAQVDASVGGKNGVNISRYKNMIGTFNQPDFVMVDSDMLKTLPKAELYAGFAEIVKVTLIADADLFDILTENVSSLLALDAAQLNQVIKRSIDIKAAIVEQDEKESHLRRLLNLGHTFGHAIEKNSSLLHGQAVSIGLVISAKISEQLGLLTATEVKKIITLLQAFHLPTSTSISKQVLFNTLRSDKKKQDDLLHLILLKNIGQALVYTITLDDLWQVLSKLELE